MQWPLHCAEDEDDDEEKKYKNIDILTYTTGITVDIAWNEDEEKERD